VQERPEEVRSGEITPHKGVHEIGRDHAGDDFPARFGVQRLVRPGSTIGEEALLLPGRTGGVGGDGAASDRNC
jgi:hypothetical protein